MFDSIHNVTRTCKEGIETYSRRMHTAWGDATEQIQWREVYSTAVVISLGILCFGLGRLSRGVSQYDVSIDSSHRLPYMPTQSAVHARMPVSGASIVASKKGKKYHYVWCPGAQTISEKNKRYFLSTAAARAAGLTPASNCPDLQ